MGKHKTITRKHDGNSAELIGFGLCMLLIFFVMIASVHFVQILECKRQVSALARQCLLYLEEGGQLTETQREAVVRHIQDMGFSTYEITYNENNTLRAYGEEVSIRIHISATLEELQIWQIGGIHSDRYEFNETLYSVCKAQT